MHTDTALIVFSHLRWDFVYQRPQHLMSRLAAGRPVYFIEEPVHDSAGAHWTIRTPADGVTVCQPNTPASTPGFSAEQMPYLVTLARRLRERSIGDAACWLYTPMALPLVDVFEPRALVYDCMDELSLFRDPPPGLLDREAELLKRADLVFTGGPSIFRAKAGRNPSVHCFPSSVDAGHFGKARGDIAEPAIQSGLARPRLGFFGVIDERFDVGLLDAVARARPDWQFVMVGPVVKIDPETLPRHGNILYTGQQKYAELPAFLSGWDVCLLPFALNDSTKFISPTKTLEYMAADKPIVSTPITDVADPYGDMVAIARNADDFVAACAEALAEDEPRKSRRSGQYRGVLANTSWDETARQMDRLLAETLAARRLPAGPDRTAAPPPPVLIIGAGPTGLSAAYHLGEEALLLEQNDRVGGWCRSLVDTGFTFDFAGHIMFSNDPYVHEMYRMLLGDNVHWQDREAWIYSKNVYTRYPFQGSLYGLPPQVIKECIVGAIEARVGSLSPAKPTAQANDHTNGTTNGHANGHGHANGNRHACATRHVGSGKIDGIRDCCGDGVTESTAQLGGTPPARAGDAAPANFEEFIYKVWGAGIAKHFAIPYNRKLWAVPLSEMETSWLGGRVPLPNLEEMIEGALSPSPKPMGPNARFGYPLRGGFQALMDGFLPHLRGRLRLNSRIVAVSPRRRTVALRDGTVLPYEQLVSTMPLPVLVRLTGDEAPAEVRAAAAGLR